MHGGTAVDDAVLVKHAQWVHTAPPLQVFAGLLADSGLMWREKRAPPYDE